jgi:hypothetical protein
MEWEWEWPHKLNELQFCRFLLPLKKSGFFIVNSCVAIDSNGGKIRWNFRQMDIELCQNSACEPNYMHNPLMNGK